MSEASLLDFLKTEGIPFQRFEHPPVYTCEEARAALPDVPGTATKNLFLRDEKGKQHFLLVVSDEKQVDLKQLSKNLEVKPLSLASADRLKKYLLLEPGSVTLFGIWNDKEKQVRVLLDEDLKNAAALHCHPLVNTATLVVSLQDIFRFLEITGHEARFVPVPCRMNSY